MPLEPVAMEIVSLEPRAQDSTYPKYYECRKKFSSKAKTDPKELHSRGEGVLLQEGGVPSPEEGAYLGWPITLRKEKRSCVKPHLDDITLYLNFSNVSPQHEAFLLKIQDIPDKNQDR